MIALSDLELRSWASCLVFSKECLQIDAEEVLQRKPFGANDEGTGDMLRVKFLELFVSFGIVSTAALDFDGYQGLSLLENIIAFLLFVIAPVQEFESVQK